MGDPRPHPGTWEETFWTLLFIFNTLLWKYKILGTASSNVRLGDPLIPGWSKIPQSIITHRETLQFWNVFIWWEMVILYLCVDYLGQHKLTEPVFCGFLLKIKTHITWFCTISSYGVIGGKSIKMNTGTIIQINMSEALSIC